MHQIPGAASHYLTEMHVDIYNTGSGDWAGFVFTHIRACGEPYIRPDICVTYFYKRRQVDTNISLYNKKLFLVINKLKQFFHATIQFKKVQPIN